MQGLVLLITLILSHANHIDDALDPSTLPRSSHVKHEAIITSYSQVAHIVEMRIARLELQTYIATIQRFMNPSTIRREKRSGNCLSEASL